MRAQQSEISHQISVVFREKCRIADLRKLIAQPRKSERNLRPIRIVAELQIDLYFRRGETQSSICRRQSNRTRTQQESSSLHLGAPAQILHRTLLTGTCVRRNGRVAAIRSSLARSSRGA